MPNDGHQIARDREMHLRHLNEARRHVEGERHIAEQEDRVADLARGGHNTAIARELLDIAILLCSSPLCDFNLCG